MGQFLSQFFLNPAMLLGTTLVALPIIIYLLNRRRFQRRRWAAMEFLLRALKRNRRRLQVQNLLLLIVRCLIVLLIVLLAARPVSRLSVLNLSPDKSQNWILVLDTSYSMGYVESSRTLFEQARETVFSMIDDLLRSGDQVAVLAIDQHPRTILAPTRLDEEGRKSLRREMEALRLSNNSVDLGASFAVLDELCGKFVSSLGEPEPKRIVFFSDLQRKDWIGEEGPKSPGLPQFMEKIQKEGGTFAFAQLGVHDRRSNLAVTDLFREPCPPRERSLGRAPRDDSELRRRGAIERRPLRPRRPGAGRCGRRAASWPGDPRASGRGHHALAAHPVRHCGVPHGGGRDPLR
jgi:hypothetical protein